MNDQSPPKRVTRARATGQVDTGVKTTKIATAASKAKVTRAMSTSKRKSPSNEVQDDNFTNLAEDIIEPQPQMPKPRGRPKKVVAAQPDSDIDEIAPEPPKTRGRPRKNPVETVAQPPRPRGRPRKVDAAQAGTNANDAPAKTTRARAATISKASTTKKSVQFDEPDKENIIPASAKEKGAEKVVATGLRAKPLRKPAVPAARAARSQPSASVQKSPLSPKKTTQIATGKDDFSDDELAGTGKTPTKPLAMSPVKPPAGVFTSSAARKLDFSKSNTLNKPQDLSGSVMASPARRPPSSPFKESAKTSPKGSHLGDYLHRSPVKLPPPTSKSTDLSAPAPISPLRSPARRPQSPMKVSENGSPSRSRNISSTSVATPNLNAFKISKFATPRTLTKGAARAEQILGSKPSTTHTQNFSGRLSSILPRDSDPVLSTSEPDASDMEGHLEIDQEDDLMVIDETVTVVGAPVESDITDPLEFPFKSITGAFNLREVDDNPFQDSESEDELGPGSPTRPTAPAGLRTSASSPSTPILFTALSKTPRTAKSVKVSESQVSIGFTPLAHQLGDWMPVSPDRRGTVGLEIRPENGEMENTISANIAAATQSSPAKSSYFDDEMSVRDGMQMTAGKTDEEIVDADFSPVELDEEDYALAHEADEMSLLESGLVGNIDHAPGGQGLISRQSERILSVDEMAEEFINAEQENSKEMVNDAEPSEVSQDYGDENAIPIDPALLALDSRAPATPFFVTPKRVLTERVFHTISKVPLKGEGEHSPNKPSPVKRSASVSKVPSQRSTNTLARSNTVISYSPSKKARSRSPREVDVEPEACATPSGDTADVWSTIGTPARTPRRDLNPALLKGAVVFVDVHTTEGADASGLFVELLTQMGARCVKSWTWNGNKDDGGKIGITHVVFKDGGRRTLEKAKETGGVISCVGVGWVLE